MEPLKFHRGTTVRRREFITLLGTAAASPVAWSLAARAQHSAKVAQIGFLYPGTDASAPSRMNAILSGLQSAGFHEPDQVTLIPRVANGDVAKLASMATELVERKVDVIHAISPAAIRAARAATSTIPIVAGDLESDPVAAGFVSAIARPGGNITGVFLDFPEFGQKWLQALKEVVPQAASVAIFWDPTTGKIQLDAVKSAAAILNVRLEIFEVREPTDAEAAFAAAGKQGAGALLMLSSPFIGANTKLLASLTMTHRLPAITLFTDFARDGGLMAYGPNLLAFFCQQGVMDGKILQGAKPAQLPVEAPTRFEFVLNLKTAKQLALTIPPATLLRADEVIE
jgi:putative tryptophan/tyrosine transport system substrate-binding protein